MAALAAGLLLAVQGGAVARAGEQTTPPPEAEGSGLLLATGDPGALAPAPMVATDVYVWVTGIVLRAQVTQQFHNPTNEWVEGIYVFPLPEMAAVDHLRMKVGARVIEGEIRERGEARRIYDEAKESGRKASLVAQQRPNVFTNHVANIGPGESVEVTIEYQETLRYDDGQLQLRFPSVVAPRYGAKVAGSDDDALQSSDEESPAIEACDIGGSNTFSIAVELDAGFPLATLYSPSHPVSDVVLEGTTHLVHLEEPTGADRDFVLVWSPSVGDHPQAAIFTERRGDETYALLMMMPPDQDAEDEALPRETVFVLDTSGSMVGPSLEQAKLALHLGLDSLTPRDRFNVIEFNSVTRRFSPGSVAADSESIGRAHEYVDALEADGGTEMRPALEAALEGQPAPGEVRQVIFVTDGAIANETALFETIQSRLGDTRLFTVGIGPAPNSYFMRKAAQFGRGTFTYIGSVAEVSERMSALFRKIEQPALTDIRVDWSDPEAEAWPARLNDLYRGEPVVLSARLHALDGEVVVTGSRGGTSWESALSPDELTMNIDANSLSRHLSSEDVHGISGPAGAGPGLSGIGVLWARGKIEALMDSVVEGADRSTVRQQVLDLGLEHHLVTQYTSLVAVDVTPTAPEGAAVAHRLAVNAPSPSMAVGGLPSTATPARLYAVVALLLAAASVLTRSFGKETPCAR